MDSTMWISCGRNELTHAFLQNLAGSSLSKLFERNGVHLMLNCDQVIADFCYNHTLARVKGLSVTQPHGQGVAPTLRVSKNSTMYCRGCAVTAHVFV